MDELHIYGHPSDPNGVSLLCPEGLALCWLIKKHDAPIKVVATNNDFGYKLPLLKTSSHTISEYRDIARYITGEKDTLLDKAILSLVESRLAPLAQYQCFVNKKNYDEYTRNIFRNYFSIPVIYWKHMEFRNKATRDLELLGLEQWDEKEEEPSSLSKLHDKFLAAQKRNLNLTDQKNLLRALRVFDEVLNKLAKLDLQDSHAGLLVWAYLKLFSELPDESFKTHLENLGLKFQNMGVPEITYESSVSVYSELQAFATNFKKALPI